MDETNMINRRSRVDKILFGYNMKNLERIVWIFVFGVVLVTMFTFGFIYYPIHTALVIGSDILFAVVHILMSKLVERSHKKKVYARRLFYLGMYQPNICLFGFFSVEVRYGGWSLSYSNTIPNSFIHYSLLNLPYCIQSVASIPQNSICWQHQKCILNQFHQNKRVRLCSSESFP